LSTVAGMKKIFLTGASSGIGRATAELLVSRGHEVWGTSRDITRLPQLARLRPIRLDLANARSIETAFNDALREAGTFDVLINNAGSGFFGTAESLPMHELQKQFQTLVFGHIDLCHRALEVMRRSGRGLIINVTSLVAELPVPFMACYNAAKSAMASYTMSLQLELATSNIRVVDLQPGDINTAFNDAVLTTRMDDPRVAQAFRVSDANMKKAPKPEFVARRIADLMEPPNPPPRVIVGDVFQTKIAPLIDRLLPQRLRLWGLRQYYKI
jgi:NAD(P)-dependent dehydrogenase (short-subunit alcohol dehydrogenase family)